jgi:hypothetical protein
MIVDDDADPADAVRRIRAVADTMARGLGPEHPATLEARLLLTLIVADRDTVEGRARAAGPAP